MNFLFRIHCDFVGSTVQINIAATIELVQRFHTPQLLIDQSLLSYNPRLTTKPIHAIFQQKNDLTGCQDIVFQKLDWFSVSLANLANLTVTQVPHKDHWLSPISHKSIIVIRILQLKIIDTLVLLQKFILSLMLKSGATKIYCNVDVNASLSRLLGINPALTMYVFIAVRKVGGYFFKKFILEGNFKREKVLLKTKHSKIPISYLSL